MTGHCGLREHLHEIGKSDEINCRLCNKGKENILHFLTECSDELIVKAREDVFEDPDINSDDLKLLKFAKITNIYDSFFPGKFMISRLKNVKTIIIITYLLS